MCHYDFDMLKEFVGFNDAFMLSQIQNSCNISHSDMEKFKRALLKHLEENTNSKKNSKTKKKKSKSK